jgi:hypothetical protein
VHAFLPLSHITYVRIQPRFDPVSHFAGVLVLGHFLQHPPLQIQISFQLGMAIRYFLHLTPSMPHINHSTPSLEISTRITQTPFFQHPTAHQRFRNLGKTQVPLISLNISPFICILPSIIHPPSSTLHHPPSIYHSPNRPDRPTHAPIRTIH